MQPSAYMSPAPSLPRPIACSGDQYSGVPISTPVSVSEPAAPRDPREAEVARQHPAAFALDQDVRGRQVAVDDTSSMRIRQRLRDRSCVRGSLGNRDRQATECRLRQIAAVHVLHHEERLLADADVVEDAHDVVVREARERACLPVEPAPLLRLVGDGRPQQLDRDVALQPVVVGAPDHAHAALADLLEKLVAADQHRCRQTPFSPQHSARPGIGHPQRFVAATLPRVSRGTTVASGVCWRAEGGDGSRDRRRVAADVTGRHLCALVPDCVRGSCVRAPAGGCGDAEPDVGHDRRVAAVRGGLRRRLGSRLRRDPSDLRRERRRLAGDVRTARRELRVQGGAQRLLGRELRPARRIERREHPAQSRLERERQVLLRPQDPLGYRQPEREDRGGGRELPVGARLPGDWDPGCLRSWLEDPDGDGVYTFQTTALPAGSYETKVAINESWDENYGQGGTLNGANIAFTVPVDNARVTFTYDASSHVLTVKALGPNDAPDGPGALSHFDLARKDCLGTARNTTSKVWFTVANGVLSDVYYPTVDNTNVETLQYVVTDGSTFTDLQTRDMTYTVAPVKDSGGMACEVTATAKSGKYSIVTDYVADPARNTLLMQVALRPTSPSADYRLYVRFDPTVNGNGGGGAGNGGADSATVDTSTGHPVLVASDPVTATNAANRDYAQPVYAALDGSFSQVESGFAGETERRADAARRLPRTDFHLLERDRRQRRADRRDDAGPRQADGAGARVRPVAVRGGRRSERLARGEFRQDGPGLREGLERLRQVAELTADGEAEELTPAQRQQLEDEYYVSANVIKASEDKTFPARSSPASHRPGVVDLGRRSSEHVLRLVSRGVRPRPVRGVDGPTCGRRSRDGARRDALPLQPAAAGGRVDAAE